MTGVDPAARLIEHARAAGPASVEYRTDDGATLRTVADGSADLVTAALSLNHVPDLGAAFATFRRILRPAGTLAFTIPHPCFEAPRSGWTGTPARRVVGDYLTEGFWRSANPEGVRRAGTRHRTLTTYLTTLLAHGFTLEALAEPPPPPAVTARQPQRTGLPPFLAIRARRWA